MTDNLLKLWGYLLFLAVGVFFTVGVLQGFINLLGWTMWWIPYTPLRMLEFSAIFAILAMFLLLIEIKNQLKEPAQKK